jgi:hypothetical protein
MLHTVVIPLWQLVIAQFRHPELTDHGAIRWLKVLRNGQGKGNIVSSLSFRPASTDALATFGIHRQFLSAFRKS